jgi:hypothetical protein
VGIAAPPVIVKERAPQRARADTRGRRHLGHDQDRGFWAAWGPEIAIIATLAGALPLLAAAVFHSLGHPTSDDWSYLASLANLAQHGTINLNQWASTFELGQLLLVSPLYLLFGVHPVLAVLWVWVVGMVGLFGLAQMARRCGLPRGVTLVALAALSLSPLYFQLSTTFMTDVPCFTLIVLGVNLWMGCEDRARFGARRWAALALITVAFSLREVALFAALPILGEPILEAHQRGNSARRTKLIAGAMAWGVLLLVAYRWRQGLPSSTTSALHVSISPLFQPWLKGWLPAMFGLFLLPVLVATQPRSMLTTVIRRHRRATAALVVCFFLIPAAVIVVSARVDPASVQLGNIVSDDLFMPIAFRVALSLLGLVSFVAIVLVLVGGFEARSLLNAEERRRAGGLTSVIVAYAVGLMGGGAFGLLVWDRYWFVVLAFVAVLVGMAGKLGRQAMAETARTVPAIPPARTGKRNWLVAASLGLIALYSAGVLTDISALRDGSFNFAEHAATQLPAPYGAEDISVSLQWIGWTYLTNPAVTFDRLGPNDFRIESHDAAGSYWVIDDGSVSMCSIYAVETRSGRNLHKTIPGTVQSSPVIHGLFTSFRFALVRLGAKQQCHRYF